MHCDIPSSHGDIPVAPFQFHKSESAKTHILVLSKFQLYGVCLWLLLVSGTQVSWLVRTLCPDSPSICKCIFWVLFFISYLILAASRLFTYTIEISNKLRYSNWLVGMDGYGNVSNFWTLRMCSNTNAQIFFWTEVKWAGDAELLDWGSPLLKCQFMLSFLSVSFD